MRIFKILTALYPSKACGQDEIRNCMLKEYAELLCLPNQQDHQPLFKRAVSSENLEVRGRVSSTKGEAG